MTYVTLCVGGSKASAGQYILYCPAARAISRLTIVSHEAKKKQAVRDEQVSYLHVAPL